MTNLSPIALFVYNRPWHTRQTLEALSRNILADKSKLYIYADGAKENATEEQIQKIKEVRKLLREKKWCGEVEIIERDRNLGLANSVITGVTEIVNKFGKIIVLEDDLVTSAGFLRYMNDALNLYENEEKVMHISGFSEPIGKTLPVNYFISFTSCWGWGTWEKSWKRLNTSSDFLLKNIEKIGVFDFNLGVPHYEMLQETRFNPNFSWAILWHASVFINNGLCLHPHKSLVRNIGNDGSGVNCGNNRISSNRQLAEFVEMESIPLEVSDKTKKEIIKFYNKKKTNNVASVLKEFIPVSIKNFIKATLIRKRKAEKIVDWYEQNELLELWGKDNVWQEIQGFLNNKEGTVLDIGCGNGKVMEILLLNNRKLLLHGCDISARLIQKAKERGIDASLLSLCNASDLIAYSDNFCDYSYSIGLLQYIKEGDIEKFFRECFRVTKKISYHNLPVSYKSNDEGWINSWHSYQNNSINWWKSKADSIYNRVEVIDSEWMDDNISIGKWIICYKE